MSDDTSTTKGRSDKRGDKGAPREKRPEDSPAEIAVSILIERLTAAAGEGAIRILPDSLKSEIRNYAKGKNLAGVVNVLARAITLVGGDEEIRGALEGIVRGLGAGVIGVSSDELPQKMKEHLDGSPDLKKLAALAAEGRFMDDHKVSYLMALSYLAPEDQERLTAMIVALPLGVDQIDLDKARFSPRELKATASMIQHLTPETAGKYFVARFKKADSKAQDLGNKADAAITQLRAALDKIFALKPGERPLEGRLREGANTQLAATDTFAAAMQLSVANHRPKGFGGWVWHMLVWPFRAVWRFITL